MKLTKLHKQLEPLYENGFDSEMVIVYMALLKLGKATTKEILLKIQDQLNISYHQIYYILKKLKKQETIEIQQGIEKNYTPINPSIILERFRHAKIEKLNTLEQILTEDYARTTSDFGLCTIQTNQFHFSSIEMGIKIIEDKFMKDCQKSIIFIATPPFIFKRLKIGIIDAYTRGISIEVQYSNRDFEELPDYIKSITPYIQKCNLCINKRQYRTYEAISIDDAYTRVGQMLIDGSILVNYPYYIAKKNELVIDHGIDLISGFYHAPSIIKQILKSLHLNPIAQQIHFVPPIEANLLEILHDRSPIQRSELSTKLKISGHQLKELITRLVKEGKISIVSHSQQKGRPKELVQLR